MNGWFDTHSHLNDEAFDEDRQLLVEKLPSLGIDRLVVVGYDGEWKRSALSVAKMADYIYATLGVHPHDASNWTEEIKSELESLSKDPKVVAIGEIGLDYHYDFSPREDQRRVFAEQLELSKRVGLPVVVHMREATGEALDIIRSAGDIPGGVMHCFAGSAETACELTDRGWYISFSGSVTFKSADKLRSVVPTIPLDRILVETDCPYLAPIPMRGKRNQPDNVQFTGAVVAGLVGMPVEELRDITFENGKRFFGID